MVDQENETTIAAVQAMDRAELIAHIRRYPSRFPLDFDDDFLQTMPLDELRHIFAAACLQNDRPPV